MRSMLLVFLAIGLLGCNKIDANRGNGVADQANDANSRLDRAAPPASTSPSSTRSATSSDMPSTTATSTTDRPANADPAVVNRPPEPAPRADNTAVNQRDRDPAAKTPIDQNENKPDLKVTADIRQRIVNAKDMSINARNVKIITANGRVTLRGPVNSAAEHDEIVKIARDVAGEANVDDELEVAAEKP